MRSPWKKSRAPHGTAAPASFPPLGGIPGQPGLRISTPGFNLMGFAVDGDLKLARTHRHVTEQDVVLYVQGWLRHAMANEELHREAAAALQPAPWAAFWQDDLEQALVSGTVYAPPPVTGLTGYLTCVCVVNFDTRELLRYEEAAWDPAGGTWSLPSAPVEGQSFLLYRKTPA
jgi:hypothetical protein